LILVVLFAAPAHASDSEVVVRASVGPAIEGHNKVNIGIEGISGLTFSCAVVTMATSDGSATRPEDYGRSAPNGICIRKGHRFGTFHVLIVDDLVPEPEEMFYVTISGATVGGGSNTLPVTIEDNDS
jgi:hypothetical protein